MNSDTPRLHEVSLEFLRHGPPHNQLLSTIANYLALCGDQGAASVRPPFDHGMLEDRLEDLSYRGDPERRGAQLEEMGAHMRELLSSVPGFAPSLSTAFATGGEMAHLRLVLTPNELALLPFECAFVPPGAPGGGGRLFLQSVAPVTITREVRGAPSGPLDWPKVPRVLFAWASPEGVSPVPYRAHLLALRRALQAWVPTYRGTEDEAERRTFAMRALEGYLTVIPQASLRQIEDACQARRYTHVHLLAHGVPTGSRPTRQRVGMALHHRSQPGAMDIVDGTRLANALRLREPHEAVDENRPAMVTVASCDSGRVGSVTTHGASLAHDLHVAGIPVVIASQFPLSMEGSVVMADELYGRVLRGEDVRVALHRTRRRLHTLFNDRHDWASLVAYVSLPPDFDVQVAEQRFEAARMSVGRSLDEADQLVDYAWDPTRSTSQLTVRSYGAFKRTLEQMTQPEAVLMRLDDASPSVRVAGTLASTLKRKAELLYWAHQTPEVQDHARDQLRFQSLEALARARDRYRDAMERKLSEAWTTTQYLCLSEVLRAVEWSTAQVSDNLFIVAEQAGEMGLGASDQRLRAEAHAALAELALLRWLREAEPINADPFPHYIQPHLEQILELLPADDFLIYSTRRQFERYFRWWSQPLHPHKAGVFYRFVIGANSPAERAWQMLPDRAYFRLPEPED